MTIELDQAVEKDVAPPARRLPGARRAVANQEPVRPHLIRRRVLRSLILSRQLIRPGSTTGTVSVNRSRGRRSRS